MTAVDEYAALNRALRAACKARGLDDDARRDLIESVTGHRSSKDCTGAQLRQVLVRLNGSVTSGRPFKPSSRADVRLIHALWGELKRREVLDNPTKAALRAFCANQTGAAGAVKDPEHLTPAETRQVIEALKAWVDRAGVK